MSVVMSNNWQICPTINLLDCVLDVRISDDVLFDEDWRIDRITIKGGVVTYQTTIQEGCYSIPVMVGWTIAQVADWASYDDNGSHPQNFYEVKLV